MKRRSMKTLCLVLLLGLSVPGCSRFTTAGRIDRAYYKQLKQVRAAREKRTKDLAKRQRAETKSFLSDSPPPPALGQQSVETVSTSVGQ